MNHRNNGRSNIFLKVKLLYTVENGSIMSKIINVIFLKFTGRITINSNLLNGAFFENWIVHPDRCVLHTIYNIWSLSRRNQPSRSHLCFFEFSWRDDWELSWHSTKNHSTEKSCSKWLIIYHSLKWSNRNFCT